MSHGFVVTERHDEVAVLRLNRPDKLNALNWDLICDLNEALAACERDDGLGALVLTGGEKAFGAGGDIAEMAGKSFVQMLAGNDSGPGAGWDRLAACTKPVVAAVAGYALGGGCELAMMCDFIIAADNARFGQPEINLGVIPGLGGTQRLTRLVGRAKAMDMCLTGRTMDAAEAERAGLVSRVVAPEKLMEEAIAAAAAIAAKSRPAVRVAREAVNRSWETSLAEGLLFERRVFNALFATEDQKEGMRAFVEKRRPVWKHR